MIKIEIHAEPDAMEAHMQALGYIRITHSVSSIIGFPYTPVVSLSSSNITNATHESVTLRNQTVAEPPEPEHTGPAIDGSKLGPMDGDRERGKAAPGGRRRTNKQIAEDDAYFAWRDAQVAEAVVNETGSVSANMPNATNVAPAISTGVERIDPQDAADEAAGAASGPTPTLDDLRRAVTEYAQRHDYAQLQRRIPEILGCGVGEVPADQIAAKIAAVRAAMESDPPPVSNAKFTPIDATATPEEIHATLDDVKEAISAYAKKYDGVVYSAQTVAQAVVTNADIPAILAKTFGATVRKPSQIPPTPIDFGKALTAINTALNDNPYKRTVK